MKQDRPTIIDSHVHLDNIHRKNPERIAWMKERHIVPVSWAFANHIETVAGLKQYLRQQADFIQGMNQTGFRCFFLSGVHPRNIPPDLKPDVIRDLILPFLENPRCLGIGEIGLETGSSQEKEVLAAHLELGKAVKQEGKRIGVHTPRQNKSVVTADILSVLAEYPGIEPVTVVDHCTPETIGSVLERGYRAGITLSPIKTKFQELAQIVKAHSRDLNRIMCNTDSGTVFYEDLFHFYTSDEFSPEVRERLAFGSAAEFFSVNSSQGM